MTWNGDSPGRTRGRAWTNTVARIVARDRGICHVCRGAGADTADHVIPLAQGGPDTDDNLAAIHRVPCHRDKTGREANWRREPQRRPPEPHPGMRNPCPAPPSP